MVDVAFLGQLVSSMDEAVLELEKSIEKNKLDRAKELKTFIFDLYEQIEKISSEGVKNV